MTLARCDAGLSRRPASLHETPARLPLRVGISTRALFDVETEHAIFETRGVEAYVKAQRDLETTRMAKGAGFEAISRLLRLNRPGAPPLVEVVLLSRNAPEASLRVFASIADYGLKIVTGSFTNGQAVAPFLKAWDIDLFLSKDGSDVEAAAAIGIAAARLGMRPGMSEESDGSDELRIALDGDAVVFSDEADQIYTRDGLKAFLSHEVAHATQAMGEGPFAGVLLKLVALRDACRVTGGIRMALVTARTAPAHARAVNTLRAWGAVVDEAHFVGRHEKAAVLAAFGAHIFFDDQQQHVLRASKVVASAQVPGRDGLSTRVSGLLDAS